MPRKGEGMMKSKGAVFGLGLFFLLIYGMGTLLQSTPYIGAWVNLILAVVLGLVGLLGLLMGVAYKKVFSKEFFGETGKFLVFLTGPWRLVEVLSAMLAFSIPTLSLLPLVLGIIFLVADWIMAAV